MSAIQVDIGLLQEFERGLDPQHPERSKIPARILGYGEISTVFEIQAEGLQGLAFKRLPLFNDLGEVERYQATYLEYNRLLEQDVGIHLPPHSFTSFLDRRGIPVFYIVQKQLPSGSIGHHALHQVPPEKAPVLVTRILQELAKIWEYNRRQDRLQIAIDGQISNWSIEGFDPERPDVEAARLLYLDTSTPLFRVQGVEQLDTELFLRSAPSFLVWVLRLFFLKDVVGRYYDFHLVAVDLVANFYKEQKPELVPDAIRAINEFFTGPAAGLGIQPVDEQEVRSYYREDALIWRLYLSMRKTDRFIRRRILRREYPYILPEHVKR